MIAEVSTSIIRGSGVITPSRTDAAGRTFVRLRSGWRPGSQAYVLLIDLLVTVTVRLDETTRRALINDLLETSASPGESEILRAVEVTIVVHDDIIPWRYPAKRELQLSMSVVVMPDRVTLRLNVENPKLWSAEIPNLSCGG